MPKSEKYKSTMSTVRAKIADAKRRGTKQGSIGYYRCIDICNTFVEILNEAEKFADEGEYFLAFSVVTLVVINNAKLASVGDDSSGCVSDVQWQAENLMENICNSEELKGTKEASEIFTQAVGVLLSCNGITLNYTMIMYDKSVSKIDTVKQIAEELPTAPTSSYLLCDSWYVCEKVINAFICKGFHTVGALKTNRILYPYGTKMNVCEFAGKLIEAKCRELFHLVTVKGRKYYVYRYEGNLNGIENAVVLLSYPAKSFGKEKALRAFISTNAALSDEEILDLYVVRWEIEVYFRDCKMKLAVDKYQIRSANGIKHFWLIASLAYMIACFESKRYNFSEGYHLLSQTIRREQISFIFDYAQNGGDKSALLENIA